MGYGAEFVRLYWTLSGRLKKGWNFTTLGIFVWLLMKANREPTVIDKDGEPFECPIGGLVMGIRDVAKLGGVAVGTVRKHLEIIERDGTIRRERPSGKKRNEGSLITIPKFQYYQSLLNTTDTPPRQEERATGNQALTNTTDPPTSFSSLKIEDSQLSKIQPLPELAQLWNELADSELPRVQRLSELTRTRAHELWEANPSREYWTTVFEAMNRDEFCKGRKVTNTGQTFQHHFGYFVKPGTVARILAWAPPPPPSQSTEEPCPSGLHNISSMEQSVAPSSASIDVTRQNTEKAESRFSAEKPDSRLPGGDGPVPLAPVATQTGRAVPAPTASTQARQVGMGGGVTQVQPKDPGTGLCTPGTDQTKEYLRHQDQLGELTRQLVKDEDKVSRIKRAWREELAKRGIGTVDLGEGGTNEKRPTCAGGTGEAGARGFFPGAVQVSVPLPGVWDSAATPATPQAPTALGGFPARYGGSRMGAV